MLFSNVSSLYILSICSEQFLTANLVADASAGSAGHCGASLAAVVVVIILLCFLLLVVVVVDDDVVVG